jgi:hypothetical protein
VQIWYEPGDNVQPEHEQLESVLQDVVAGELEADSPDSVRQRARRIAGAPRVAIPQNGSVPWSLFGSASGPARAAWRDLENCYLIVQCTAT